MGEKLASVLLRESASSEAEHADANAAEADRRDRNTHSLLDAWRVLLSSRQAAPVTASEEPRPVAVEAAKEPAADFESGSPAEVKDSDARIAALV